MRHVHTKPCDLLVEPEAFGTDAARWRPTPGASADVVAGAWLQHETALVTLAALGKGADGVIAAATGENRSTAHRKLHGRTTAALADLAAWAMLAGNSVLATVPSEPRDTLPPAHRGRDPGWEPGTGRLPLLAVSEVSWAEVVGSVARSLAERWHWVHRLMDPPALRYLLSIALVDNGLDPTTMYTQDEGFINGGTLLVGTAPVMVVDAFVSRHSTSAAEARSTVSAFLASVHRLAAATSAARFLAVLGDPIGDASLAAPCRVGAATAEASGAENPDPDYWETELTPVESLPVGDQHLWVVAVGKLDRP